MQQPKAVRRQYSQEFKDQAIQRVESGQPSAQVARDLGIRDTLLHAWRAKRQAQQQRHRTHEELQAENARLKRQLAQAEEEVAILKKAAAYFAKELK